MSRAIRYFSALAIILLCTGLLVPTIRQRTETKQLIEPTPAAVIAGSKSAIIKPKAFVPPSDLKPEKMLAVEIDGPMLRTAEVGQTITLSGWLVNKSPDRSIMVKRRNAAANDTMTTFLVHDDTQLTEDVQCRNHSTCDFLGHPTPKTLTVLKPGEKLPFSADPYRIMAQEKGVLYTRLRYKHIRIERDDKLWPEDISAWKEIEKHYIDYPDEIAALPSYEIVSDPVHIRVSRSHVVVLKLKRPLKVNEIAKVSEIVEAKLVNISSEERRYQAPTNFHESNHSYVQLELSRLKSFNLQYEFQGRKLLPRSAIIENNATFHRTLKPAESFALLGSSEFANGTEFEIGPFTKAGTTELRIAYIPAEQPFYQVVSDWIQVPVEE